MGETQGFLNMLFIVLKIFAIFPVSYQITADNKQICFRWKSFKAVYAVTVIFIMSSDAIISVYLGLTKGINSVQLGNLLSPL